MSRSRLCVVLFLVVTSLARAETVTFMSNIGQGNLAAQVGTAAFPISQSFITGPNADGYALESVSVVSYFAGIDDFNIVIRLAADNAGTPGTTLATLGGPKPTTEATYTYTTAVTTVLSPSTKYWIRMSSEDTSYYGWRQKTTGGTLADGWSYSSPHPASFGTTNFALEVRASPNGRHGIYFQDFSAASVGATSFGDGSSFFSTAPSNTAGVQDSALKELQLTQAGSGTTHTAFMLPDLDPGRTIHAFSAKWNMELAGDFPDAADGFSFNFGRLSSLNLAGSEYAQESGYGRGISFGIQTYFGGAPGFYVRAGTNVIAYQPHADTLIQWGNFNARRHFIEVDWHHLNGLTVRMNHQTIFTNVPTYGYTPQSGSRVVFAARTGGSSERVRLDNIAVVTGGILDPIPLGSPFHASVNDFTGPPANAFDGLYEGDSPFWVAYTSTGYIGATTSDKRRAVLYTVSAGGCCDPTAHPREWTFQGSTNAGGTWTSTDVDGFANFQFGGETRAFVATNSPSAFSDFRLNITSNGGNGAATRVAELRAYKLTPVHPEAATSWTQASEPDEGWLELTCSADGLRMAGLTPDGVSLSSNFGFDWTFFDTLSGGNTMASSADGRSLLVGDGVNGHFESVNGEDFFIQPNSPKPPQLHYVACSTNFRFQTTAVNSSGIWYSADSGTNWTYASAPAGQWRDVAMSGDGRIQAAVIGSGGGIYVSLNTGVTWTTTSAPGAQWDSVAMSKDGARIIASIFAGGIYYSSNTGATWTASDAPNRQWDSIACSDDGMNAVAVENQNSTIYLSTDAGASWTRSDAPIRSWKSVAMSSDGHIIAAGENTDQIWISALMPGRPHASTLSASNVISQQATVRALVRPFGAPTTVGFAWGTTTNYGNTNFVQAGASTDVENGIEVSLVLSNLVSGTTYYYRAFATNTTGPYVSLGDPFSFTVPGVPDVGTDPATAVTYATAQLNGTVNPKGAATTAWFAWGTTTNVGSTTSGQNMGNGFSMVPFSAQVTNLASGTKYYYRAMASNQFGMVAGPIVEFTTLETVVILDATSSGSPITGSSGNSPATQMPAQAIDNTPVTKYLNFDKLNTGFDVSVFDTGKVVRGLTLISAEDSPERDPTSYTLWGSPDGTNFTLIASNAVPGFVSRNAIQSFVITNSSAFAVYRVLFPTIVNEGTANSMQIAEVELLTSPEISSSSDTITASHSGTELTSVTTLVDRRLSNTNKWVLSPNPGGINVDITPAAGRSVLKAVELIGAADDTTFPERHPIAITLFGSDDGLSWFAIGIFSTVTPTMNHRIEEFVVPWNTTPYNRYRITFGQQLSGVTWQLDEVRLFGDDLTPLESWRYDNFGTTNNTGNAANDADGDVDGNRNLLEFASGTDPEVSNSSPLFRIALSNGIPQIYYIRDTNAQGTVSWSIESTTNLQGLWSERAGLTNMQDPNDPLITTRFEPAPPLPTGEFYRLNVTLP